MIRLVRTLPVLVLSTLTIAFAVGQAHVPVAHAFIADEESSDESGGGEDGGSDGGALGDGSGVDQGGDADPVGLPGVPGDPDPYDANNPHTNPDDPDDPPIDSSDGPPDDGTQYNAELEEKALSDQEFKESEQNEKVDEIENALDPLQALDDLETQCDSLWAEESFDQDSVARALRDGRPGDYDIWSGLLREKQDEAVDCSTIEEKARDRLQLPPRTLPPVPQKVIIVALVDSGDTSAGALTFQPVDGDPGAVAAAERAPATGPKPQANARQAGLPSHRPPRARHRSHKSLRTPPHS